MVEFVDLFKLFLLVGLSCFCVRFIILLRVNLKQKYLLKWELNTHFFKLDFSFFFDYISLIFLVVLLLIVGRVYLFGSFYLLGDPYVGRFFIILTLFVASMVCLIIFPHSIFVLIGYDGLGVIRFVLVVYYGRRRSWVAGLKTFLINRLGDGLFILGIVLMLFSGEFLFIKNISLYLLLTLILFFAWFTKRAQYPFSSWLPAAMAAPTPVSALVHSSTLVTAGIYLLIRLSNNIFEHIRRFCTVVGLITLFIASFRAIVEWDSKKIVAFSTLRQLGLMVYRYGMGLIGLCFFHLIRHAIFKALMFIVVGYLIFNKYHFQDLRHLCKLGSRNYFLFFILLRRVFSLRGFPFLVGFYSKDLIIENFFLVNVLLTSMFFVSLILTRWYGGRLILYLLNNKKSFKFLKIKVSWFYLRVVVLWVFILWFGKYKMFYFVGFRFIKTNLKFLVVFFITSGGFLSLRESSFFRPSLKNWSLFKIGFLKVLKTFSLVNYFSQVGSYFYFYVDQGLKTFIIKIFDLFLPSSQTFLQFQNFSNLNIFYWCVIVFVLSIGLFYI